MIEPQAQKRGIRMTFQKFDSSWFVNADRTRLKQVLINLLSNAIKYNREQGTVKVKCALISAERIRIQRPGHRRGIACGKAGATVSSRSTVSDKRAAQRKAPALAS